MNLDSRLLSFPLYVCCNFLYTSPHSDHRPDSSEQESTAHSVPWCPVQQPLTAAVPLVMLKHLTRALTSLWYWTYRVHVQGKKKFLSVYWVFWHIQSWWRTHYSGQEGLGRTLPSEQLQTLVVCQELMSDHFSRRKAEMREQFQLDLYCRTAAPDGIGSEPNWQRRVRSEENTTHADSLYRLALYWKGSVPTLKLKLATASLQPAAIWCSAGRDLMSHLLPHITYSPSLELGYSCSIRRRFQPQSVRLGINLRLRKVPFSL